MKTKPLHALNQVLRGRGFALVATVMMMVLLLTLTLGIMSLATLETRHSARGAHQQIARANARMALMVALGELQSQTGPDQRVTATASVLEDPGALAGDDLLANRNWLGVWKTTHEAGGREWPLIGKVSTELAGAPYSLQGAYQDLRHSLEALTNGGWKQTQLQTWLVSKRTAVADPAKALDDASGEVIEMLGRGTLGEKMSKADYEKHRVLVEKVDVLEDGQVSALAWYVSDNNQKACIDPHGEVTHAQAALEAAPRSNPALVKRANGELPYKDFVADALPHAGKMMSYATAALSQADPSAMKKALGEDFHHFTCYAPGLFVDTMMSGLRRDLTPLLLARKGESAVDFTLSRGSGSQFFSSTYPVIPGPEHGVLGPSFGALRNWAQHCYTDLTDAQTAFGAGATRMRPAIHWPHGVSDGACADAAKWAEHAPKIHPVMTECRWHYYFSHRNKRIRSHIIPRVCLWNPYNRSLKTSALSVLMPNPYYDVKHGVHFFPDKNHVEQDLKGRGIGVFESWVTKGGYVGGDVYKIRTNPFPPRRYLAFTLEGTELGPGQCQVFSPKVTSGLSSGGVRIQRYQPDTVSANVLSPSSLQGADHYYYDHDASVRYQIQAPGWKTINPHMGMLDLDRIFDYQPALDLQTDGKVENFPFALKVGKATSLEDLYSSDAHPTLQLINNGAGGTKHTKTFHYQGLYWGSANQKDTSFGYLQTFKQAPTKNAPSTHQVGGKLLWLNETVGEGDPFNKAPHRYGTSSAERWGKDHMVYNVCPVANWNVRAQLVSRSPVSQCANKWYMNSMGPWLLQFVPYRPLDANDMPAPSGGVFVKNPFGLAVDYSLTPDVVLFDLPSKDYGVISMAGLRHAMLSPYSWSPSYLVGHSLRDMHAPAAASAHAVSVDAVGHEVVPTRWDYLLGDAEGSVAGHGARCTMTDSRGLLQIGNQSATRSSGGDTMHSSADEVLAYDIAYELNYNLWDGYFLSSMPLSEETDRFEWNPDDRKHLWNRRYQFNPDSGIALERVVEMLSGDGGLNVAFFRNAEFFKNKSAFNVNSTSVEAWTAFLSGTLGIQRPLAAGELEQGLVSFARYRKPKAAVKTGNASPDQWGGWTGSRQLTADEVRMLAARIVDQVKKRGPFVSVADFINRRLSSDQDESSRMGVVDAAIQASGLNRNFELNPNYLSTSVNAGASTDAPDNNMNIFKASYRYQQQDHWTTVQPTSKAWGLPGFLTQGDVLEPLAPSLSVRGDTFTIRAYGESSQAGVVKARAWLEATVERGPRYVEHQSTGVSGGGNVPTESLQCMDHNTGACREGDLNEVNRRLGRRYLIKTQRWLDPGEV